VRRLTILAVLLKAAIGFPRIALSNNNILAAWNGDDGVHLAIIKPRIG
jgi:hypothetical protein